MYSEHTIEPQNRIELAYKGKREHIVTPNVPNVAYPGQTIMVEIPRGSSDTTMVRETEILTFNLELASSKDKTRTVVPNIGRNIVAKKTLTIGSTELEVVENCDIFDTYKDLYLTEKQRENMHFQGIQPKNGLDARVDAKKVDGTDLKLTTAENAVKTTLGNRFMIPLDFEYFKQPLSPYYLQEKMFVTIELNKPGKIMVTSDNQASYKITDLTLEYDAVIDGDYTDKVSKAQANSSYPYTRITRSSYEIKDKKKSSWLINTNLQAKSLQGLLLLFIEDRDTDFAYKVENFYNPTIKKVNVTIDGNPHQLFKGSILPQNMYHEIIKKFDDCVSFEDFLTTKYGLWIDTRSSTDNKLHGSGRIVNSGIKLQIDKVAESSGNLTCYIFAVQDAYVHLQDGKLDAVEM